MTHEGSGGQGSPGTEASRPRSRPPSQAPGGTQAAHHGPGRQPSHGGGVPARDRELRAQGRATVKRLLDAGMIEFEERGFHGVRVDDVVRRAGISHGTFYLYFSNKEDLFKALLLDALRDMETIAGDFPVVTRDEAGKTVLRRWVAPRALTVPQNFSGRQPAMFPMSAMAPCSATCSRAPVLIREGALM